MITVESVKLATVKSSKKTTTMVRECQIVVTMAMIENINGEGYAMTTMSVDKIGESVI